MRLAVNVDHIATIREARKAREPEPVAAPLLAELAGAEGIKERDLTLLRATISTRLNVEMAATPEMARIALDVGPDQVTLVPERPQELTTEGGLDVVASAAAVEAFVQPVRDAGVKVSLFIDSDPAQVRKAKAVGADAVEINTGPYTEATGAARQKLVDRIAGAARLAADQGLEVLCGHGLNYVNVGPVVAIPEIVEANIGHAIVARAALVGLDRAVREMIALLQK